MKKRFDLTGQRFGKLTATGRGIPTGGNKGHNAYWNCQCDCGKVVTVATSHLTHGDTKSCGCLKRELTKQQFKTHGATKGKKRTKTYRVWLAMRERCINKNNDAYQNYGGRGITVCDRWQNYESFLEDMGPSPRGLTIDRIDNSKGYYPANCRWTTQKEQNNNRRDNRHITYGGVSLTISQWADHTGINMETIRQRIMKLKWPAEKALTTPSRRRI